MADGSDGAVQEITAEGLTVNVILGLDAFADPVDVSVRTPGGEKYTGTFFTFEHVQAIMQAHAASGESLGGKYFWAKDAIIVRELDEDAIVSVVLDLWRDGQLPSAMTQSLPEETPVG